MFCPYKANMVEYLPIIDLIRNNVMLYLTKAEMLEELGRNLREARLADNLSQSVAAERSGISLKAIRNLEDGKNASTASLLALCKTLRRTDWIANLAPPEINDALFDRPPGAPRRRRASPSTNRGKERHG
jgi:transcriptional regulator with XRE-family HTH domain